MPPTVPATWFRTGSLTTASQAHRLFDRFPAYDLALRWIDDFVMQPAKELGRPGHVCPRLAATVQQNLLHLVAVDGASWSVDEAVEIGLALASLYGELFPDTSSFLAGSLLAIFPELPEGMAAAFIDEGHRRLRTEFVSRGLMIGEFHVRSQVMSVRNEAFPVMQSPVPMFAVRALTQHDLMFLDLPKFSTDERRAYLGYYLHHLEGQLSSSARARATASLAALEAALEKSSSWT